MSQETVNGMHHSKGSQVMPVNLNRWLLPVLALWFLFVTSSGSKTLLPSSTPFLVTIVLLVGLMLAFRQQVFSFRIDRLELPAWYTISLLLFGLLILAYGFAYSAQTRGLIYFVKFLSIAIFFLVLLRIRLKADDFFKILLFVFLVNFLVLMFAIVKTDFQFAGSRLLLR